MERTARVEVTVLDDSGKLLPNAKVSTWPNIRYGEWAACLFGGDCYNSADLLQKGSIEWHRPPDLETHTDSEGVAILANVPATETQVRSGACRVSASCCRRWGWSKKA
jgi:hypothetical protein